MKLTLILLTIVTWHSALGQLYTTYTLKGDAYETAGRVRFVSTIELQDDYSFIWITEKYNFKDKTLVSSDTTKGTWTVDKKVLSLDNSPMTTSPNESYDTYLVRNKRLKRTAFKGKWRTYKASGDIIKMDYQ
jgi:hypothetical protein